jgi:hypothetical protein
MAIGGVSSTCSLVAIGVDTKGNVPLTVESPWRWQKMRQARQGAGSETSKLAAPLLTVTSDGLSSPPLPKTSGFTALGPWSAGAELQTTA